MIILVTALIDLEVEENASYISQIQFWIHLYYRVGDQLTICAIAHSFITQSHWHLGESSFYQSHG